MEHAAEDLVRYLETHKLVLTTAESCTAGTIVAALSKIEGCGSVLECGYVVYSINSKKRLLKVSQSTIDRCDLTSEAVAREMAEGALADSDANAVIATTGIAGSAPQNGIPPGTICFAWGFRLEAKLKIWSETRHFLGSRHSVQQQASTYAMQRMISYHQRTMQQLYK